MDGFSCISVPPFHRVPEHDDEAGVGLQGMQKVLDEERRLSARGVVIEVDPGVVVPHGGGTGFPCNTPTPFTIMQSANKTRFFYNNINDVTRWVSHSNI